MKIFDQINFSSTKGAPENKNFPKSQGFTVTLKYNGHRISFPFYIMGKDIKDLKPEKKEVIDCIVSDALAFENSKDVLDFASEFGYPLNTKSEKDNVRKIFKACQKMHSKVTNLVGKEGFDHLIDDINELNE